MTTTDAPRRRFTPARIAVFVALWVALLLALFAVDKTFAPPHILVTALAVVVLRGAWDLSGVLTRKD